MINILVPTRPDDHHALFVKLALEKNGHNADLWFPADFPSQQTHSFEIMNGETVWKAKGSSFNTNHTYDVVWYRRPAKPIMPDILHPEDIESARKESRMFFQGIWQTILTDAVWINPVNASLRANAKLLQLKIAAHIGMKIPKTLISNDPEDIKKHLQYHNNSVIYKTLYPIAWLNKNEAWLTYASKITSHDLPNNQVLQATPGIFQEYIDKKYELRITYFGNDYIAVKINSQEHEKSKIDWRYAPTKELKLEQVILPNKINELCRLLMKKLGIVFGCFDMIVTPHDEYYFLEVNEQGQFLWIEDVNPNIKMLERFIKFMLSFNIDSQNQEIIPVSLEEFNHKVENMKIQLMSHHKIPPLF